MYKYTYIPERERHYGLMVSDHSAAQRDHKLRTDRHITNCGQTDISQTADRQTFHKLRTGRHITNCGQTQTHHKCGQTDTSQTADRQTHHKLWTDRHITNCGQTDSHTSTQSWVYLFSMLWARLLQCKLWHFSALFYKKSAVFSHK
jgi:hypothetical protein